MKAFLFTAFSFFLVAGNAQELIKNIGVRAKEKLGNQDFNSTRSNKEQRGNNLNEQTAPAPAPGADTTSGTSVQPSLISGTKHKDSYTFKQKMVYEISDKSDSSKAKYTAAYYYSDGAIMLETPEDATISDFENEAAINLDEKDKTATVLSARWSGGVKEGNTLVTRTGNVKQILGYTCEEYIVQDKKTKSIQWVTSDIKLNYTKAMSTFIKKMDLKVDGVENFNKKALLMEITFYNKKGEEEMHLIMTEYTEDPVIKSLKGYKVKGL